MDVRMGTAIRRKDPAGGKYRIAKKRDVGNIKERTRVRHEAEKREGGVQQEDEEKEDFAYEGDRGKVDANTRKL